VAPGIGNLNADPRFVPGDFRIASDSPVIDHADPTSAPTSTRRRGSD
jgi:hypothetical protein